MAGCYKRVNASGANVWYVKYKDRRGVWVSQKTSARNERDAKSLAHQLEQKSEKIRLELEQNPGTFEGTFGQLCAWAYETHFSLLKGADHDRVSLRRHGEESRLGQLPVAEVTSVELTQYFSELEHTLTVRKKPMGPGTINRIRARFSKVFELARDHGLFVFAGENPALGTKSRREPRRPSSTLSIEEIPRVLEALPDSWRGLFATCLFSGLRKGEVFALEKRDVNLQRRVLLIQRSHEHDSTKGGGFAPVPIHEDLVPYLEEALLSPGPFLFPNEQGQRRNRRHKLPPILRAALVRAGIVERYDHVCRRRIAPLEGPAKQCGHVESHPDDLPRRCPECHMKLWPVGVARPIRFHDTRHSFATHALESGASLVAVQKILRHSDPRLTTRTYGHLATQHLRDAVNRIDWRLGGDAFGNPDDAVAALGKVEHPLPPSAGSDGEQGGSESGLVTPVVRAWDPECEEVERSMQLAANMGVETAGIEPAAYALRNRSGGRPEGDTESQVFGNAGNWFPIESKNSYQSGTLEQASVTPVVRGFSTPGYAPPLHASSALGGGGSSGAPPRPGQAAPPGYAKTANRPVLQRLFSVAEVAELLSVSREWVRKRIERGELEHQRLGAHTRVPEAALSAFLAKGQK